MKHFIRLTLAALLGTWLWTGSSCKSSSENGKTTTNADSSSVAALDTLPRTKLTPTNGNQYTVETQAFSLVFPAEPRHQIDTLMLAKGVKAQSHAYLLDLGSQIFALIYIDYPGKPQPQQIIEEAKAGILSSFYGEPVIRKDSSFEWQGHPAIELTAGSAKDGLFLHYRLLAVGPRLYQIAISSTDDFLEEDYVQDFFNHFQLKK